MLLTLIALTGMELALFPENFVSFCWSWVFGGKLSEYLGLAK